MQIFLINSIISSYLSQHKAIQVQDLHNLADLNVLYDRDLTYYYLKMLLYVKIAQPAAQQNRL